MDTSCPPLSESALEGPSLLLSPLLLLLLFCNELPTMST